MNMNTTGPSFFFVQTTNHQQPLLETDSTPILSLTVYCESDQTVVKLDASIQLVCATSAVCPRMNIEVTRNGTYVTSHIAQFEDGDASRDYGFWVITENLTWADTPDLGANMYQVQATLLTEEENDSAEQLEVFAGTRSLNATVFS